ncbi:hypothetical protein GNP09_26205, partial [Escherichia coli]|nr:hypothetical protein [Escherichia coli]
MKPDTSRIAAKMLSLQQGGYMTLAQFAMTFWHDLAAP